MLRVIAGGATITAAVALALPASALSAGPKAVQQGYSGVKGASVGFRHVPHVAAAQRGALPFTGLDLGLVAAGGGGLLLLGGALKKASERE